MTDLSKMILSDCQIRKTKKQKTEFIEFMKKYIPELRVEEGGMFKSRNLVVGNIESADVVFTAHYDTCAALPFPNLIAPKNFLFTLTYGILVCLPFFAVMALVCWLVSFLTDEFMLGYWIAFAVTMLLIFFVFMGGKPNKHTANDNTSGVITLIELMSRLSDGQKKNVAFVFFDNEENGLLGSAYFAKRHKKEMQDKLLINFDCVSDGNNIVFVQSKKAKVLYEPALKDAVLSENGKTVYIEGASSAFYPSDQMNFPVSIAVAALKRKRFIGLYLDRIHTKRDTVFDESNIEFICDKLMKLLQRLGTDK